MKAKPFFIGACVLASVAGAVGGATTNTIPLQNGGIGLDMLPERHVAFDASESSVPEVALPDHYAMTTPQGRVEVAELATRGLYAQQRFGWREADYERSAEPAFSPPPGEDARNEPTGTKPPRIEAAPRPVPVAPLELARPADQVRIVDVAAALASTSS